MSATTIAHVRLFFWGLVSGQAVNRRLDRGAYSLFVLSLIDINERSTMYIPHLEFCLYKS